VVVAVNGVVPGAGATTVASALAAELAGGHGTRTVLIEATLRMGVLAMHLNARPALHLTDLLAEADKLGVAQFRKALAPVAPRLDLLAAPPDMARPVPDPAPGVLKLISLAREAAEATVIDLPCTFDDLHFETLWAADRVVLVADQSLPAVRTARMILDAAAQAKAVKRVHVVLNRYDPAIAGLTAAKVGEVLGGADVTTVPGDYVGVMRAANEGRLLRDLVPDSPVVAAVRAVARSVMGPPKAQPERKFMARLLGLFE
jgi:pilus assembly protein CpaE